MKFDPTKKFGTVHGACDIYPGARYSQKGFIYDASHKCLNPKEAETKESENILASATENLLDKKKAELKAVTDSIVEAQKAIDENGTAGNKGKLTKLTNKYNALVEEIAKLEG